MDGVGGLTFGHSVPCPLWALPRTADIFDANQSIASWKGNIEITSICPFCGCRHCQPLSPLCRLGAGPAPDAQCRRHLCGEWPPPPARRRPRAGGGQTPHLVFCTLLSPEAETRVPCAQSTLHVLLCLNIICRILTCNACILRSMFS